MLSDIYSIVITKVPGGANPVISHGEETIEELFATAFNGESIEGYQIMVNGETVDKDFIPGVGENVTLARQIKGN